MSHKHSSKTLDELKEMLPFEVDRTVVSKAAGFTYLYSSWNMNYYEVTLQKDADPFHAGEHAVAWHNNARAMWDHARGRFTDLHEEHWVVGTESGKFLRLTPNEASEILQRVADEQGNAKTIKSSVGQVLRKQYESTQEQEEV